MIKRWSMGLAFLVLFVFITGCFFNEKEIKEPAIDKPIEKVTVITYLPSETANGLIPVNLTLKQGKDLPKRVLDEMIALDAKEKYPTVPKGTAVLSVTINPETKVANVDFNNALRDNMKGGSLTEELVANMIVNTLTNLEGIEAVQFLVEGKKLETLSGHMDFSQPIRRNENIIKKKKG